MAVLDSQLSYNGPGYIDSKLTVEAYEDLKNILSGTRFVGLTVTALNATTTKKPMDYWLVGGTTNSCWKLKQSQPISTYTDLSSIPSASTYVGLIVTVLNDDKGSNDTESEDYNPNYGKIADYWVTARDTTNKIITWERKKHIDEITTSAIAISGDDID